MKLAAKAALILIQIFGCPSKRKLTILITYTHPCNIGFFEIILISCTPVKDLLADWCGKLHRDDW